MAASTSVQGNVPGVKANFEELYLLTKTNKPAIISLQKTLLTIDEITYFTGLKISTQRLPNGTATCAVALFVNKGHLFSQVQLDTPVQAVAARMTQNETIHYAVYTSHHLKMYLKLT